MDKDNYSYCGFGVYLGDNSISKFEKLASGEMVETLSPEAEAEKRFVESMTKKRGGLDE